MLRNIVPSTSGKRGQHAPESILTDRKSALKEELIIEGSASAGMPDKNWEYKKYWRIWNRIIRVQYAPDYPSETKKNPVVSSFGIRGIPTKVVIDGNGVIRFKSIGYNGKVNMTVEEMTVMIELAKAGNEKVSASTHGQ